MSDKPENQSEISGTEFEARRATDSVRVVMFDAGDPERFLLVTEVDDRDNWKLPGGKFNLDEAHQEPPDEAAAREVSEELGADAGSVALTAADRLLNDDGVSARYIYWGELEPGQEQDTEEVAQRAWVTVDSLPETKNQSHILSAVESARASRGNAGT